jgi:chromosomal replication initiation ATPase DnaA
MNCVVDLTKPTLVFLYGTSGSGKTYLMKRIREALGQKGLDVLHCSAQEIVDGLVESVKSGNCGEYRSAVISNDALLISFG